MGNRATQFYPLSLAANGTDVILAEGAYYRIISSTGAVQVRPDGGSSLSPLYAGQGQRKEFKRLTVTDKSGAANTILIIVADDDFIDDRITGEVSVIDGEKARTLAGGMFMAATGVPSVAAQFPHAQLWNSSTTKNIIVSALSTMSTLASQFGIGLHTAALGTDVTATGILNKLLGGPASSAAQLRYHNAVAVVPTIQGRKHYGAANQQIDWMIKGAIVVPPSKGLVLWGSIVNQPMDANFEFFEENL